MAVSKNKTSFPEAKLIMFTDKFHETVFTVTHGIVVNSEFF